MAAKQTLLVKAVETRGSPPLGVFGTEMRIKLGSTDTNGDYAMISETTPPNGGPPLHRHTREDASFYIVEGQYVFEVDGQKVFAGPGSSVYAPEGTAHRFLNLGSTAGRMLIVVRPAGLDEFFTDIDRATAGAAASGLSVVIPIFEKHGLELLGPPMQVRSATESHKKEPVAA